MRTIGNPQYFTLVLQSTQELLHVPVFVAAHVGSVHHDEDVHPGRVLESSEQLGSEEEVLGAAHMAGCLHQHVKHQPLVASIHALVDLIHTPEENQIIFRKYFPTQTETKLT